MAMFAYLSLSLSLSLSLGTLGTLWFIFWLFLGFDSPASHPRISLAERKYIESSIAEANKDETNKKV